MAIDDNTSYELTGYQVKDLAQKIRAKADSNSLASVATSGLYSDLTGAPTIPTVYNGTLTIQQNGTTLGTFSANQSTDETIDITGGGETYTAGNAIDITDNVISADIYPADFFTSEATVNNKGNPLYFKNAAEAPFLDLKMYGDTYQISLPNEYQQVGYLDSSGGAYILLDYYLKGITEIDIKVQYPGTDRVAIGVMGNETQAGTGSESNPKYLFTSASSRSVLGCYYYDNPFRITSPELDIASETFRLRTKIENGNFNVYINDGENPRCTLTEETFTCPQKTTLFGIKGRIKNQRVYYARFYENNVKVVEVIPCYRKSDNVPGMYDTVNGKFYTNAATTGEFIVGADVPNPDYPRDIQTVTGEQTVSVSGKNLLKFTSENITPSSAAATGATITIEDNSLHFVAFDSIGSGTQYAYYYTGELDPDVTYTISGIAKKIAVASTLRAVYSYSDDGETWASSTNIFNVTDAEPGTTVNLSYTFSGHKFYRFGFYNTFASVISGTETIYYNMQIEQGSTATGYVPYQQSQSYTINLGSIELCKIDNSQDYIYRDGEDWYLHKATGKIVLDGTETWSGGSSSSSGSPDCIYVHSRVIDDEVGTTGVQMGAKSSHFTNAEKLLTSGETDNISEFSIGTSSSASRLRFLVRKEIATSQETWITWLGSHNPSVYYSLATPTDTQITDSMLISQLETLWNGNSYDGETRISAQSNGVDLPFVLDVTMVRNGLAGLKQIIDSKQDSLVAGENISINGNTISAIDTYSTTEQPIGTWIDGSTIYKKTINIGALPAQTSTVTIAHGISNFSTLVKVDGTAYNSTTGKYVQYPKEVIPPSPSGYPCEITATDIVINQTGDGSAWTVYITLYYTKSS